MLSSVSDQRSNKTGGPALRARRKRAIRVRRRIAYLTAGIVRLLKWFRELFGWVFIGLILVSFLPFEKLTLEETDISIDSFHPLPRDAIPSFSTIPRPVEIRSIAQAPNGLGIVALTTYGVVRSVDNGNSWSAARVTGNPATANEIFVTSRGTLLAFGGRIIRSTDGGASWSPISENQTEHAPDDNLVSTPDGTLLGLSSFGRLSRSNDDGVTWSKPDPSQSASVSGMCVDHSGGVVGVGRDGTIVRATAGSVKWSVVKDTGTRDGLYDVIAAPGGSLVAVGNDIVRSTDGGATWNAVLKAGPGFTKVRAYGDNTLIAIGTAIARSGDGGATWSIVERRYTDLVNIMPEPNGALLAVGWRGLIIRSTDDGKTWRIVHKGNRKHPMPVLSVAPDGALLAGGRGPVERSVNGGANWSISRGINLPYWKANAGTATLHPLSSIAGAPNGVFVAVGENGTIVRSVDNGRTWADIDTGEFSVKLTRVIHVGQRDFVAVGTNGTVARSDDVGASWSTVADNLSDSELKDVVARADGIVVAVGTAIARSGDYGKHWVPVSYRGPPADLRSIVITSKNTFVAVGSKTSEIGSIIVRSTDGGFNWVVVEEIPSGFGLSHVAVETGGSLVAVGKVGTVLRSTDDGRSWSLKVKGLTTDLNHIFAGPERLLVATGKRALIIRSNNGGKDWSAAQGTEEVERELMSVSAQTSGALIAVGENNTILRSNDHGASWSLLPTEEGNNLHDIKIAKDGTILAVGGDFPSSAFSMSVSGEAIITRGAPSKTMAPSIRQMTHAYSAGGVPLVRIWLDDPSGLCPRGKCLTVRARSLSDHRNSVELRPLPEHLVSVGKDGAYTITVDPSLLSANRPDPMFMQVRLAANGFSQTYPNSDAYFTIPNNPHPVYRQDWFITVAAAVGVMALLYATLLLRPLWLLGLATRPAILDTVPKAGLPGIGDFIVGAVGAVILPILSRHPKVLNAWVDKHSRALAEGFSVAVQNVSENSLPYTALPIDSPERSRIIPSPALLATYFRGRRACVQIVGQGGVGKTTLALEIGRWLHNGDMTDHPAVALFVDEEFDDVLLVVQAKLGAILAEQVQPNFLRALLSSGRIWLIIDRVSERTVTTRRAFTHLYRTISPRVVISTARYMLDVDGQKMTVLRPRPLDSTTLLSFLSDQLVSFDSLQLFPRLGDQSVLVQRLARQIAVDDEELPITPLLVRVFVTRAVELVRSYGIGGLDKMPDSVPEAYFNYVERLDAGKRTAENGQNVAPELLRRAAALVAYVELGGDFRPKPVELAAVEEMLRAEPRLAGTAIEYVQRLEENGLLVRRVHGTEPTVEYLLDPLAECLAAFEYARLCGGSPERWTALIEKVMKQGPACNGFILALRMNYTAYRTTFRFPPVAFPDDLISTCENNWNR